MCNEWKEQTFLELTNYLQTLSDEKYKNFNDKIINTSYKTLGLRTPVLKKISKEIMKTNYLEFLTFANSSNIYEVQILSGLVISNMSDLKEYTKYIKNYTKKMDSWSFTDMISNSSKILDNTTIEYSFNFLKSSHEFTKRFGYVIILDHYLKKENLSVIFDLIKKETTHAYYVDMAISWLLCELYVKFTSDTYEFIKNTKIPDFIVRKATSKVNDSFRVSKEDKDKLKKLKDLILTT